MAKKMRWQMLEYLGIIGESSTAYHLLGTGVTKLSDSPGAKVDKKAYINDMNTSAEITGYENSFAVAFDKIVSDTAINALEAVGDQQLTGDDAKFELVRVDLNDPDVAENTYAARQYFVAYEAGDSGGDGLEVMTGGGTLHQIGDMVPGTYNTSTDTFTPDA